MRGQSIPTAIAALMTHAYVIYLKTSCKIVIFGNKIAFWNFWRRRYGKQNST